jgi:hypothetical protein
VLEGQLGFDSVGVGGAGHVVACSFCCSGHWEPHGEVARIDAFEGLFQIAEPASYSRAYWPLQKC